VEVQPSTPSLTKEAFDETTQPTDSPEAASAAAQAWGQAERRPHLVVMTGTQAGLALEVGAGGLTLGRTQEADLALEDDSVSRRHARLELAAKGDLMVFDLGSRNGTLVNGARVEAAPLRDGDRLVLGAGLVLKLTYMDRFEAEFQRQLFEATVRDGLTGAFNQRYFSGRLEQEFAFSLRHGAPLSLCLVDVDHFKTINDQLGHLAGDEVLRRVPRLVADAIRVEDVLCRCGGDELAIMLRQISPAQAQSFAERIRRTIATSHFSAHDQGGQAHPLRVSVSIGVATFDPTRHRRAADLVAEADRFLYLAKQHGRNRVASALVQDDDPTRVTPPPAP